MPHLAPAVVAAIIGGVGTAASAGASILASNKARKQDVEDQTRYQVGEPDNFGDEMTQDKFNSNPGVTLLEGGRRIKPAVKRFG